MKRVRDPGPDTDIITFTVVIEKSNPHMWEASVDSRPALSYVADSPKRALKRLVKSLVEEGLLDADG